MLKKLILSISAAGIMMFAAHSPASAAMAVASLDVKPAQAAADIVKVGKRGGRGFRRGKFHRGGFRFKHRKWRHRRHWHRYGGHWGKWSWYRRCKWKQRRGHRIYCPKPVRYYY